MFLRPRSKASGLLALTLLRIMKFVGLEVGLCQGYIFWHRGRIPYPGTIIRSPGRISGDAKCRK